MAAAKFTPARQRALEALVAGERDYGHARVSNETDVERGYVYWQSARWLLAQGLAIYVGYSGASFIRPTDAGRRLAARLDTNGKGRPRRNRPRRQPAGRA